nr:craniofacial development protein 2-like [Penaeus vannamei]
MAETFWKETGEFDTSILTSDNKFRVIFSGGDRSRRENKKFTDTLLVLGDFNGRVSNRKEDNICGQFGLGDARTDNGERIVEFCRRNKLLVANTWFQQKEKTRHTWTSPDGQTKNQIDYILVSARFRNSIRNCKSRPGAYCGSDHNPVIVNLNIRLKNIKKKKSDVKRWTWKCERTYY